VLAIAASNLRHLSPEVTQYRVAECYYLSCSLRDYQTTRHFPPEKLGQDGVNRLLLSGVLLNVLAFAFPESEMTSDNNDPGSSWVFLPRQERLGWLALHAGLRFLFKAMDAYLEQSLVFLGPFFFGGRKAWGLKRGLGVEIMPERWVRFFQLDSVDSSGECGTATIRRPRQTVNDGGVHEVDGRVYLLPAIVLAQLRHLEPVPETIFTNLFFLGKMDTEFRELLFQRDRRALWLFGYWLGLMCRYQKVWWFESRVTRDYKAVCLWLDGVNDDNDDNDNDEWKVMMDELKGLEGTEG
jgi:hypothetical protein